jgi:hypothetical protein
MNRLTRHQAELLLPAIIDDEASEQEKNAFFEYLKYDRDLEREYYSTLQIKRLLNEHLPKKPAPEYLKNKILRRIEEEREKEKLTQDGDPVIMHKQVSSEKGSWDTLLKSGFRYMAAAAVILMITLMIVQLLERSTGLNNQEMFVIENISAQHFAGAGGKLLEPHFSTNSPEEAEQYLLNHHGLNMTIPHLKGADFAGIVLADFHNGMEVPLLEYVQNEIDENIFIFAINLSQLQNVNSMKREENAAESCTTQTDYFVNNIDGIHVVSWLWGNNWYSAVSNHNGHDLAALVEPLNQD